MQPLGTLGFISLRDGYRLFVVDGLARVVALDEPYTAPIADVDRREEDHAPAARTKFDSNARPASPDFSGWNCVAITFSRSAAQQNSTA